MPIKPTRSRIHSASSADPGPAWKPTGPRSPKRKHLCRTGSKLTHSQNATISHPHCPASSCGNRPRTAPSILVEARGDEWLAAVMESRGTGAARSVGIAVMERETGERIVRWSQSRRSVGQSDELPLCNNHRLTIGRVVITEVRLNVKAEGMRHHGGHNVCNLASIPVMRYADVRQDHPPLDFAPK